MVLTRARAALAAATLGLLALAGCAPDPAAAGVPGEETAGTVRIEDNEGPKTVTSPPASVVATDNRTFRTLADWGVELSTNRLEVGQVVAAYVVGADAGRGTPAHDGPDEHRDAHQQEESASYI